MLPYSVLRSYNIVSTGGVLRLFKLDGSNLCHVVNSMTSTCTCKSFQKNGYCKHLLFVMKKLNKDSNTVLLHRTFKYRGNTRRTREMRGRVADARPALQRNR